MLTRTPLPITMTNATLRAQITALGREHDRAAERGDYRAMEECRDALDACHAVVAARSAQSPEAVARAMDAYDVDRAAVLAAVWEMR
jgi:hypothetical protein